MTHRCLLVILLLPAAFACSTALGANNDTLFGQTSSISNAFTAGDRDHPVGSHFHSSNLDVLPDGNPPIMVFDAAEVGGFFDDEEIRGVSEFNIQGPTGKAILFFEVRDLFAEGLIFDERGVDGLFGQGAFEGLIDVFAYAADYMEQVSDYEIPPIQETPILSIDVTPSVRGGDEFSVDVTSIFNELAATNQDLGVRLQMANPDRDAGAITFANFRVELEAIPEPQSWTLLVVGLFALLRFRAHCRN